MKFFQFFVKFFESLSFGISTVTIFAFWMLLIGFSVGQKSMELLDMWGALTALGSIGLLVVALLFRDDFKRKYIFTLQMDASKRIFYKRNRHQLLLFSGELTQLISLLRHIHKKLDPSSDEICESISRLKDHQYVLSEYRNDFWEIKPDFEILSDNEELSKAYGNVGKWMGDLDTVFRVIFMFGSAFKFSDEIFYRELKAYLDGELTDSNDAPKDRTLNGLSYGGMWAEMWNEAESLGRKLDDSALYLFRDYRNII